MNGYVKFASYRRCAEMGTLSVFCTNKSQQIESFSSLIQITCYNFGGVDFGSILRW